MRLNIKNVLFSLVVVVFGALAFSASSAYAATCTATAGGNWNTAGTWTDCTHVPTSSDDVIIPSGQAVTVDTAAVANTVTMNDAANTTGNTLTISSGQSLSVAGLSINASTGTGASLLAVGSGTLTDSGNISIFGGSSSDSRLDVVSGSISAAGINFSGIYSHAKLTAGNSAIITITGTTGTIGSGGTLNLNSTSTVVFTGTGSQILNGYNYGNLTIDKQGGTATLTDDDTFLSGELLISSGTLDTSVHDINITGVTQIDNGATLIHGTGSKVHNGDVLIQAGGTWTETAAAAVEFIGNVTNNGTFTASTGLHTFAIDNRSIYGTLSIPNVVINGNDTNYGTLTIGTALTGTNTLTNGAGGVLNIGGIINNYLVVATATGNEVHYVGANQTVYPIDYDKLFLEGSGIKAIAGVTVANALSIDSGVSAVLAGISTADSLLIDGVLQVAGTWGSTSSSASHKNNTYFSGIGILTVATGATPPSSPTSVTYSGSSPTHPVTPVAINISITCGPGQMFSATTGAACTSNVNVANEVSCTFGQMYNPSTGLKCTAWTGGTAQTPAASMSYDFGTTLVKEGSKGDSCKAWQMYFNDKDDTSLVVDGKCGPKTMDVAKKWQSTMGLKVDGMLGAMSRAKAI